MTIYKTVQVEAQTFISKTQTAGIFFLFQYENL